MSELVKYEAAARALAEAVAVDEVKQIHDHAEALRHAARIAGNKQLEIQAAQIRFRAERRFGELMAAQHAAGKVARGGRPRSEKTPDELVGVSDAAEPFPEITLRDIGVDYRFSSRAQKLAELPAEKFESLVDRHAEEMRSGVGRVTMDLLKIGAEEDGRERRRQLARELSDATAQLPSGRRFPVIYADPPWKRKQGVTNRSYENHYDTMSWDDICAMPIRDLVLPDAWLFLWIPRAHMFALHEVDTECVTPDGEVVTAKIKMPLAWAVAKSWGFDAYSTAFVWTKTDEEHPADQGGGVIVFDQDEMLLMFKRGRGLPKPATDEKFGSNHRERSKPLGHSRKPEFYRDMIGTMSGGVPVLELFARVDAEHPLPEGWEGFGNQAGGEIEIQESGGSPSVEKVGGVAGACSALSCGENRTRTEIDTSGDGVERHAPPAGADTGTSGDGIANCPESELARRVQGDPAQQSLTSGETESEDDDGAASPASSSHLEIDEFTALKALSDYCFPNRAAIVSAIADDYIARGYAFQFAGKDDWSLREEGWARLRALDDARRATHESNSKSANGAVVSRETLDALCAVEAGAEQAVDDAALEPLRARKLVTGKAKPKLTKEGRRELAQLREHFDRLDKLERLPTELRQLTGMYGNHLYRLNEAVERGDKAAAAEEAEMLDLLAERANGNTHFGVLVNEGPEQLRNDNAAPIGQAPMWRQRGVWQIDIDGVPYIVTHDDDTNFAAHAVDPTKPCISSTGYRSFAGPPNCFALGHTVSEQAEAYIREYLVSETDLHSGKKKPRKSLPLPEEVYRLPLPGEGYDPQRVDDAETLRAFGQQDLFAAPPTSSSSVPSAEPAQPSAQPVSAAPVVQTRIPLDDEEIELRDVLAAYARGEEPGPMPIGLLREIDRDLIGRGWLDVDIDAERPMQVTAEGHAWLASLVDPVPSQSPQRGSHVETQPNV